MIDRNKLISILIIITVFAVGLFTINQMLQFTSIIQAAKDPCGLCYQIEPRVHTCFDNARKCSAYGGCVTLDFNATKILNEYK